MIGVVVLNPGDAYLLKKSLEVTLNIQYLKNMNWLRSERITREEASTLMGFTLLA